MPPQAGKTQNREGARKQKLPCAGFRNGGSSATAACACGGNAVQAFAAGQITSAVGGSDLVLNLGSRVLSGKRNFTIARQGSTAEVGRAGIEDDVSEREDIPIEGSVVAESRGAADHPEHFVRRREASHIKHGVGRSDQRAGHLEDEYGTCDAMVG